MKTIKAGCFLIDKKAKCVALIYRKNRNDFSFPKGHLEEGEDIKTCAIRETEEETKRAVVVLDEFSPYVETYTTPSGENCECYMFFALDAGKSNNLSTDTHDLIWTPFNKVEQKLTYNSLKVTWNNVKQVIQKIMNS